MKEKRSSRISRYLVLAGLFLTGMALCSHFAMTASAAETKYVNGNKVAPFVLLQIKNNKFVAVAEVAPPATPAP